MDLSHGGAIKRKIMYLVNRVKLLTRLVSTISNILIFERAFRKGKVVVKCARVLVARLSR